MAGQLAIGGTPLMGPAGEVIPTRSVTEHGPSRSHSVTAKKKTDEIVEAERKQLDAMFEQENAQIEANRIAEERQKIEADAAAQTLEGAKQDDIDRLMLKTVHDDKVKELEAREQQKRAEMDKAGKPTSYWEDLSVPRKILAALALAGGAASGTDAPMKIYEQYEAADRQKKMDALAAATKAHAQSTGDIDGARRMYQDGVTDIQNRAIKRNEFIQQQVGLAMKKLPQTRAEGQKAMADLHAKHADLLLEQRNQFGKTVSDSTSQTGTSTTMASGMGAGEKGPTASDREKVAVAEETAKIFDEAAEVAKRNPQAVANFQKAFKDEMAAASASKTGVGGLLNLLKAGQGMPLTLDQRLKTKDERIIARATVLKYARGAKKIDSSGAISDKTLDLAQAMDSISTTPPEEFAENYAQEARGVRNVAAAVSGRPVGPIEPPPMSGQPAAQPAAPVARPPAMSADDRAALKWASQHPKDPRAKAIVQKIRAERGK